MTLTAADQRRGSAIAFCLLIVVLVWGVLVVVTPQWRTFAAGSAPRVVAVVTYAIGATVCHQRPDRSFATNGIAWPVCARCSGLYVSAAVAVVVCLIRFPRPFCARSSGWW
jgi:hypothetical protein